MIYYMTVYIMLASAGLIDPAAICTYTTAPQVIGSRVYNVPAMYCEIPDPDPYTEEFEDEKVYVSPTRSRLGSK